jgi:putative hydrolase of the HAD superfamily
MSTPAIIFDFGNVIAFFDYRRACDTIGRPRGRDGAELLRTARDAGFDDLLRRFERGQLSAEEFSASSCRMFGLDLPAEEFAEAWADIFWLNEEIVPTVLGLREAGLRLVLGSNTNILHADRFRSQFAPVLSAFDRLVLSFDIGHSKPSPEFYLACAEAAGAPAGDCIFIDDLAENVEGARAAGLRALLYRDPDTLGRGLHQLGVNFSLSRA